MSVALHEASKWTDFIYQAIQFMQQKSENDVSYLDIQKTFPHIKIADESLLLVNDQDELLIEDNESNDSPLVDGNFLAEIQKLED